jgi:spore maturation protein CgeB
VQRRPRIAIIGKSRSILTWLDDTLDGFKRCGADPVAISFQADTVAERLSQKRGEGKEMRNPEIVKRSAAQIAAADPDLVLVLNKGALPEAAATAWRAALRPGVPIVGWLCDCLRGFPKDHVPSFDSVYYFDSFCIPALERFYQDRAIRIDYLPLAVNPERYPFQEIPKPKPRLVFAGKCSPHRHERFAEIRAAGIPLDLYGPGAGNRLRFWRNRRLSSATIADLYRSHLVGLNLPQPGNTERGLNLRAFEIPAAGGIGTYPDVPDLPRCFEPGREILVYRSPEDLARQFQELLSHPERAAAMIHAGHERVLRDHTFEQRARTILRDHLPAFA